MKTRSHYFDFKKCFANKIRERTKWQTVRPDRVRMPAIGDKIIFTVGKRSKHYQRIGSATITNVARFVIVGNKVLIGGVEHNAETVARLDGFNTAAEMRKFFAGLYPAETKLFITQWAHYD